MKNEKIITLKMEMDAIPLAILRICIFAMEALLLLLTLEKYVLMENLPIMTRLHEKSSVEMD